MSETTDPQTVASETAAEVAVPETGESIVGGETQTIAPADVGSVESVLGAPVVDPMVDAATAAPRDDSVAGAIESVLDQLDAAPPVEGTSPDAAPPPPPAGENAGSGDVVAPQGLLSILAGSPDGGTTTLGESIVGVTEDTTPLEAAIPGVSIDVPYVPADGYAATSFGLNLTGDQAHALLCVMEGLKAAGVVFSSAGDAIGWILDQVRGA
jgi:hypothetical protein